MPEPVLLKLGGSVLTRKGVGGEISRDTLETVSRVIGSRPDIPLLIVHGAGSCGHPEAHRYGLMQGLNAGNREGVMVTHRAVSRLNTALVDALRVDDADVADPRPPRLELRGEIGEEERQAAGHSPAGDGVEAEGRHHWSWAWGSVWE